MAQGQLPLYYKNSKLVGSSSSRTKWSEYYLLVVTLFGFLMLFAGVLWFLPSIDGDDGYTKAYGGFTGTEPVGTGPTGTDSVMPPLSASQRPIVPTFHSNVSASTNKTASVGQPVQAAAEQQPSEQSLEGSRPKSEAVESPNSKSQASNVSISSSSKGDKPATDFNSLRRAKVVQMAKHAWDGYVKYAWGENELKPVSRRGHTAAVFGKNTKLGATIVDSLDTLYLMGLREEFEKAKEWIRLSLDLNRVKSDVSVFEFNIRFVGGLLSAYALSKDEMFKDKALEIADKLMPAFNTPSGIPKSLINFATGSTKNWGWASGGSSVLAEFGSLHLEYQYLTYLSGNPIYLDKVNHIRQHLKGLQKSDGLYPNFLNPNTGRWGTRHISVGALGDSFYEYLLKSWLMTSKHDVEARDMFYETLSAIDRQLLRRTRNNVVYLTDLKNGKADNKMQHLACFAGGMFALGSDHAIDGHAAHYLDIGKEITDTCHFSYNRTASKLGPEAFRFDANGQISSKNNEKMYLLRPETVESYFVLWRITRDQKYRDWGWEVVQALEKHCRIDSGGYSGVKDVYSANPPKDDVQQTFFIAETLKYLWLLFSDDDVLPLDQWVFNTEAHPFPLIPDIPRGNTSQLR